MNTQATEGSAKPQRRRDIDWLRVLAVLLLFPFHTTRIFDIFSQFYVKNDQLSKALSYIIAYLDPWHMPLFFLLAGASAWFALRFRSGKQYASARFKRLLVPFIFGLLVLIPLQPYLGLRNHSDYAETILQWYPRFFELNPDDMDGYFLGGHTWGHLWFIIHLFVYSLVALPLFLYLNREAGQRQIERLAALSPRPGVIFFFAIPLLLTLSFPDVAGGNPLFYILFFIYGFILMADARFGEAIDRHKTVALMLGPVVLPIVAHFNVAGWPKEIPQWALSILSDYAEAFIPWFSVVALLGYGKQFLSFSNRFLMYAAEASYPFYTLHQTVIVIIGFFVVQWETAVLVKFLTILVASLVATTLVYDLLVKRNRAARFLFGMGPRRKAPAMPASPARERAAGSS